MCPTARLSVLSSAPSRTITASFSLGISSRPITDCGPGGAATCGWLVGGAGLGASALSLFMRPRLNNQRSSSRTKPATAGRQSPQGLIEGPILIGLVQHAAGINPYETIHRQQPNSRKIHSSARNRHPSGSSLRAGLCIASVNRALIGTPPPDPQTHNWSACAPPTWDDPSRRPSP